MRDGEEGDDQNDADDVQATHNGQGSQGGHDELKAAYGQTLCDSKVAVVGDADNYGEEEVEEDGGPRGQYAEGDKGSVADGKYGAKKEGR